MGSGVMLKLLKTAATNIPWGRLVQNAPLVVEMVERVRERVATGPRHDLHAELEALREENLKLTDSLLQAAAQLQALEKSLEVVVARQKVMTALSVVSLLIALASLVAWLAS